MLFHNFTPANDRSVCVFERLLKSWVELDSEECRKRFIDGRHDYLTGYYLQKTKHWEGYTAHNWVNSELEWNLEEQDSLQGYLQRCIVFRKWHFEIYAASNIDGPKFVAKVIAGNIAFGEKEREIWGQESNLACIALFSAYIAALVPENS